MRSAKKSHGMLLATLLVFMVASFMFGAALLKVGYQDMLHLGFQKDRTQALELARGALNQVIDRLSYSPGFNTDLNLSFNQGSTQVLWGTTASERSVNNLLGTAVSPTSNFRGEAVAPQTADILVKATSGRSTVKLHAVLRKGFNFNRSVGAVGQITMSGNVSISGIDNPDTANPTAVDGGLFSQFSSTATQKAISWVPNGGGITVASGSQLEALSSGIVPFSPSLIAGVPAGQRSERARVELPEYNVGRMVTVGNSNPAPSGLVNISNVWHVNSTFLNDQRYIQGPVNVMGDISLNGGTLYIKGNLDLNGGIKGHGSLLVDGNVTVRGGNASVVTNQATGATILSSGDVKLQGIDATQYLDNLASLHTSVNQELVVFNTTMQQLYNDIHTAGSLPAAQQTTNLLTRQYYMMTPPNGRNQAGYFVNPIKGPTGNYPDGATDGDIPALIGSIRTSLGAGYGSDLLAQRVVKALEEVHFKWRHNNDYGNGNYAVVDNQFAGVPDFAAFNQAPFRISAGFDDVSLAPQDRTPDSQVASGASPAICLDAHKAWFRDNPLNLNWLGKSYFQGIVYSQKNVLVDTKFTVVGSLISGGNVSLTNDSTLIYAASYLRGAASLGPIGVLYYEEL